MHSRTAKRTATVIALTLGLLGTGTVASAETPDASEASVSVEETASAEPAQGEAAPATETPEPAGEEADGAASPAAPTAEPAAPTSGDATAEEAPAVVEPAAPAEGDTTPEAAPAVASAPPAEPAPAEAEPMMAAAEAPSYEGTITYDLSGAKRPGSENRTVTYANGTDTIAPNTVPGDYTITFLGFAVGKYYLQGYSTVPDYFETPDAPLYFAGTEIATIFPDGIAEGETLYAVYVSTLASGVNDEDNRVGVNGDYTDPAQTLPESEHKNPETAAEYNPKVVTGYYNPDQETVPVILTSSLDYSKELALLTFHNNGGILTNSGTWSDGIKQGASYTHVDLHVTIPDGIEIDDVLDLSFTSWQFKPQHVITSDYTTILHSMNADDWGTDPTTTFSFEPGENRSFILRATIRKDGNPAYALSTSTPDPLFEPMVLESTDPGDFWITRATAQELAYLAMLGEVPDYISVQGHIDGVVKAGPLASTMWPNYSNVLQIGFEYNQITFVKNLDDGTEQALGTVFAELNRTVNGDELTDQTAPAVDTPVVLGEETFHFLGWNTAADGSGTAFDPAATNVTADQTVYGVWNAEPKITVDAEASLSVCEQVDPNLYIQSATDLEDGSLTGVAPTDLEITFDLGGYDGATPGTYTFTYTVTDTAGLTATATTQFTAIDEVCETPAPPEEPEAPAEPEPTTPAAPPAQPPAAAAKPSLPTTGTEGVGTMVGMSLLFALAGAAAMMASKRREA